MTDGQRFRLPGRSDRDDRSRSVTRPDADATQQFSKDQLDELIARGHGPQQRLPHTQPVPQQRPVVDPTEPLPRQPQPAPVQAPAQDPAGWSAYEQPRAGTPARTRPTGPSRSDRRTRADRGGAGRGMWRAARELSIVVIVALVLSLLIKSFLVQPFSIPSESMEPALMPGDRIVVSKLSPGVLGPLHRGDVIVFTDPGGWLPDSQKPQRGGVAGTIITGLQFVGLYPAGDNHLVKRVIGLPGDTVRCCDTQGRLMVNGVAIDEPYVQQGNTPSQDPFDITVPAGKVWVMGDNRAHSGDSREHDDGTGATGSVPESDITGEVVAVVWPLNRISSLDSYPSAFDKVPSP